MKKRIISMLLALAMVFGMMPDLGLTANAATITASGDCEDSSTTWSLDSDGVLTIGGTGAMGSYTGKGTPWNYLKANIQKVVIESGVTSVGNSAFKQCENLTELTFYGDVTNIGHYAFYECPNLTTIDYYGTTPPTAGSYAFTSENATPLTTVVKVLTNYTGSDFAGLSVTKTLTVPVTTYPLWVGGEQVTSEKLSGTGWAYVPGTNTLTLNNYTYTGEGHNYAAEEYAAICYTGSDTLTLVLIGESTVTHQTTGEMTRSYGLFSDSAITVSAESTGSLTVTGGNAGDASYGVYIQEGGLTLSGGSLTATSGNANAENGESNGVYASDEVIVSAGSLTAIGGIAKESYGIYAAFGANITGGVTVARGETRSFLAGPTIDDTMAFYDENDSMIEESEQPHQLEYLQIKAKPAVPTYTVTVYDTENGTITADKTTAAAGETVTLTITPAEGYYTELIRINGEDDETVIGKAEMSFTMPEENVEIFAAFAEGTVIYFDNSTSQWSWPYCLDGIVYPYAYDLGSELYAFGVNTESVCFTNYMKGMPESAYPEGYFITEKITPVAGQTYTYTGYAVTVAETANGTVAVKTDDHPITKASVGQEVTMEVTPDTGYSVDTVTVNGSPITPVEGVYSFQMPAGDVTVEVTFKDSEYNVEIEQPTGGSVETDNENPTMGDKVTITVTPDEGKEVDQVIVKDENGNPVEVTKNPDGTYTYEQPAGDVTVEVTFKDIPVADVDDDDDEPTYRPTVEETEGGKTSVNKKNPEQGEKVTITAKPEAGYAVEEVIVTDRKGNEIEVKDNGDGTYSFKQPYGKVTIEVVYKRTERPSEGYTDLNPNAWYGEATDYVIENGLMNGVGGGKFDPNGTTSRAMIVTILWRLEGQPVVNYLMGFEDVAAETWYTEAVRWAVSEGIVTGYSDLAFGPNDAITREQLATILWRYAQYKGQDVSVGEDTNILSYDDAFDISEWAMPAMQWACGAGVLNGRTESTLAPAGSATRAEAATILWRMME